MLYIYKVQNSDINNINYICKRIEFEGFETVSVSNGKVSNALETSVYT